MAGLTSGHVAATWLGRIVELADAASLFVGPRAYVKALFSAVPDIGSRRERIPLQGDIGSGLAPASGCLFRIRCRYAEPACAEAVPSLMEAPPGCVAACRRLEPTLTSPLPAGTFALQTS